MITRKVEEFIENYIDGKLNVVVARLVLPIPNPVGNLQLFTDLR
uniref:Uncharacterized protein n=1 Tax=Meloidogyne enterolobii TaxID=390850 RepID=A0A6V7VQS9_MELEN|nr:unnamed protein product [Meloidogyne enterolobii]